MSNARFSVAVLPFLKTSGPIGLGGQTFRSTSDVAGLSTQEASAVTEIAQMLFAQGDLRVRSASYAIVPHLDLDRPSDEITRLAHLRNVLAYLYSSPHEVFENLFLSPEEVSLVLFTPDSVSIFLARPGHHTDRVALAPEAAPDKRHNVPGYRGLYNFRHYFWIEPGSRLYGPKPHVTLNISQDLRLDVEHYFSQRFDFRLLVESLEKPLTPAMSRVYSALHWYNAANEDGIDRDRAILNLAVAFEALLRLPDGFKTERLVDAITLLLGRTERLDEWAQQFYQARSRVAHEGSVRDPYFYVPTHRKTRQAEGLFGSLLLYGRHIFQLCVGTLLAGIDLADRADLQEKFVSNNERYQRICELLKTESVPPTERLLAVEPFLRALKRYQFVPTGEVSRGALISAVRHAASALNAGEHPLEPNLAEPLTKVQAITRKEDELQQLTAIKELAEAFEAAEQADLTPEARVVRELVEFAWMGLFQIYYWLIDHQQT